MKLFTIYDTTSEAYENPITVRTTAEMERALQTLAQKDPDHKFIKYSSEHSLYEIGEFNPQTGDISLYQDRRHIANLSKYTQLS